MEYTTYVVTWYKVSTYVVIINQIQVCGNFICCLKN